jgi:3-oxoacyl-[acyl-carrier-protein] synthase II
MRKAITASGLTTDDIGHINAHGIGEVESDLAEARAIHDVFGARGSQIPVTSTKGHIGNSGAGAASLDLAASLLGLQQGLIFPTLNCATPDPECQLDIVRGEPRPTDQRTVLNINFTRFGQASAVVVQVD